MLAASLRYYDTIDMKMHSVAVRVTKLTGSAVSLPHGTVMDRLIKCKGLSILTALYFLQRCVVSVNSSACRRAFTVSELAAS